MVPSLDASIDPMVMRTVLGQFPTGVIVVTATAPDGPVGMTLQSFVSLSLEPPLVMFAVTRTSASWPRIADAGRFTVNILSEGQGELARQFARSGTDKFAGIDIAGTGEFGPRVSDSLAWIECELHAQYDGGDHTIIVARVAALDHATAEGPATPAPLVFHGSRFARLESALLSA